MFLVHFVRNWCSCKTGDDTLDNLDDTQNEPKKKKRFFKSIPNLNPKPDVSHASSESVAKPVPITASLKVSHPSDEQRELVENRHFTDNKSGVTLLGSLLNFSQVTVIGRGAFGVACSLVVGQDRGQPSSDVKEAEQLRLDPVACKTFMFGAKWHSCTELRVRHRAYKNELSIYQQLSGHPHIVRYHSCFQLYWKANAKQFKLLYREMIMPKFGKQTHLVLTGILLERCTGGTLKQWLTAKKVECLSEHLAREVFVQIGSALVYLHARYHICHRDLKWDNIAVTGERESGDGGDVIPHLKLLDFGNAHRHSVETYNQANRHSACFNLNRSLEHDKFRTDHLILGERNPFLVEAHNFAMMVIVMCTVDRATLIRERIRLTEEQLRKRFVLRHRFVEFRFQRLLLRMMPRFDFATVTVQYALDYMEFSM